MSTSKTNIIEVKEDTGEVVAINPEPSKKVKFRSMWDNPYGLDGQDLSNEIEDVFEEIQPYTIDPQTGDFLNKLSIPVIMPTGKVNVHERIQSFAKEVDLYSILEKFAYSDDPSLVNARPCAYGDISELPNDLNGFAMFVNNQFNKLNDMNPELAKMVVDESVSAEDIQAKATEIYNSRIQENKKGEGVD